MEEISLVDFIKYIARNWLVIVGLTFIGLMAGLAYNTFIQEPLYKSSATLLLVNKTEENISTASLVNNYSELFKSRSVLETAASRQDYSGSYESLLANTTSTVSSGTEVIKVSVATASPQSSRDLMIASIEAFQDQMSAIYGVNNLEIVDDANLPNEPYNVDTTMQLALSGAAGFILSLLILFFAFDYRSGSTNSDERSKPGRDPEPKRRERQARVRRSDNEIILGDDDDFNDSFLFDDSILDKIAGSDIKPRPIKKPGSKMRNTTREK